MILPAKIGDVRNYKGVLAGEDLCRPDHALGCNGSLHLLLVHSLILENGSHQWLDGREVCLKNVCLNRCGIDE